MREDFMSYRFFIAYEVNKPNSTHLRQAIIEAFDGTSIIPIPFDEEIRPTYILEKVKEYIDTSEFGIYAICSNRKGMQLNPNVVLELGIAMGEKKDTFVIIPQRRADKIYNIFSDLKGFEC